MVLLGKIAKTGIKSFVLLLGKIAKTEKNRLSCSCTSSLCVLFKCCFSQTQMRPDACEQLGMSQLYLHGPQFGRILAAPNAAPKQMLVETALFCVFCCVAKTPKGAMLFWWV